MSGDDGALFGAAGDSADKVDLSVRLVLAIPRSGIIINFRCEKEKQRY